jgi:hypothetical protein
MSERLKEKLGEELYKQIIDKGIKANEIDLLDGYITRQRFNEVNDKLKATNEKITTYEKQFEDTNKLLKESETFKAENEGFKTKLTELESKYTNELQSKDKQIENVLKKSLVKEHLITNGAQYIDLLIDKVNFDNVKVENDKLTGFEDQFKSMKENYKGLFVETVNKQDKQPDGGNSGDAGTGDDQWASYVDNMFKK